MPGALFQKSKRNPGVSTCYCVFSVLSSYLISGHDSHPRRLNPPTRSLNIHGKMDQCVPKESQSNPSRTTVKFSSDLMMLPMILRTPAAQESDVARRTPAAAITPDMIVPPTNSREFHPAPASILHQSRRVTGGPLGILSIGM